MVIYRHGAVLGIGGDVHINSQLGVFCLGGLLWYIGMHALDIRGRLINTMWKAQLQ